MSEVKKGLDKLVEYSTNSTKAGTQPNTEPRDIHITAQNSS